MRTTRENHLIFRQGHRVLPNEADSKLNEAKSYFIDGDLNKALELLDEYLLNFPLNTSAWNLKGMIYMQNGSYNLAKESLSQAINISPDDERLYYNRGLAAFHQADLVLTEEYFNRSISGNFQIPEQYFYLGLTQYGLAKYDKAVESFKKSIDLYPDDPAVWLNLGISYKNMRRLDKAISLNPEDKSYKEYLKIYDYGNYSGIIYENTVTPLPFPIVMISFAVIIIFSIIAIIRR